MQQPIDGELIRCRGLRIPVPDVQLVQGTETDTSGLLEIGQLTAKPPLDRADAGRVIDLSYDPGLDARKVI